MDKYLIRLEAQPVPPYDPSVMAQGLTAQLAHFLFPLLVELDRLLDKRLVRTFLQSIAAVILTFRDRANGLLLSELGGSLLSAEHAPAGTKRLSNLLHAAKWRAALLMRSRGTACPARATAAGGPALVDESRAPCHLQTR